MNVYVFTGPTISPAEACQELDAVYLPPAAEGDVYRVSLRRPHAIGIIDGYFHSVPTVRHKEILWAMSEGIHVFGCASIGALRAVELTAFGMEGVGRIFESYRDGILEDDDEVAVAHGPSDVGFMAGSEAMVNIRCTLQKAELDGIISTEMRTALENIAKGFFYPDRSYPSLFRCASDRGLSERHLARLRQWLPEGRVNQKREDALAMLRVISKRLKDGLKPKAVSYSFQHTVMWESTRRQSGELRLDSNTDPSTIVLEALLDELRLKGDQYKQHNLLALGRFFAIREAHRLGVVVSERRRKEAESAFRRERNLLDDDELQRWLTDNSLSRGQFDALMVDEAHLSWFDQSFQSIPVACLPDQLRLSGDYARLLERASAKDRLLEVLGLRNPSVQNTNLTESELLQWYFQEVLERCVPSDPITSWRKLGFTNADAFRRALSKEYLFRQFEDKYTTDLKNTEHRPRS